MTTLKEIKADIHRKVDEMLFGNDNQTLDQNADSDAPQPPCGVSGTGDGSDSLSGDSDAPKTETPPLAEWQFFLLTDEQLAESIAGYERYICATFGTVQLLQQFATPAAGVDPTRNQTEWQLFLCHLCSMKDLQQMRQRLENAEAIGADLLNMIREKEEEFSSAIGLVDIWYVYYKREEKRNTELRAQIDQMKLQSPRNLYFDASPLDDGRLRQDRQYWRQCMADGALRDMVEQVTDDSLTPAIEKGGE